MADCALAEDRIGVLAGRQSLPPGSQHVRGEQLNIERVGPLYRRSEGTQEFGVDAAQARGDTPGAARTGGLAFLPAPAADGTHRPAFCHASAWSAAGGVTLKAIGYVLSFLAGAALFGVLAVWFHRRHQLRWTSAAGLAGALLLLGLLLAAAPAILGRWGLLPT
jgi:hypothetical protein